MAISASDKVRVGIIGCGGIANGKHMPALAKLDNCKMVAFCDIVEEKAKKAAEQYDRSIEELTWHLIKEKLVEIYSVKVDDDDVKEMAKEVTRMQFAQYGMLNIPDEYLENATKEMFKKRETVDNLIDRCIEVKLGGAIKEAVTLEESTVSTEEFNKMFE